MPITPLHFGVLAPINHFWPGKVSLVSFTLVSFWMDGNAILYFAFGLDQGPLHGPETHSFLAAIVLGSIVAVLGCLSLKWVVGAYLGGISHILLDMLVHSEMAPLYPWEGNPFYLGLMEPLSLILLPFTGWFIVQFVSDTLGWLRRAEAGFPSEKRPPKF